jgi:hypothetical protein
LSSALGFTLLPISLIVDLIDGVRGVNLDGHSGRCLDVCCESPGATGHAVGALEVAGEAASLSKGATAELAAPESAAVVDGLCVSLRVGALGELAVAHGALPLGGAVAECPNRRGRRLSVVLAGRPVVVVVVVGVICSCRRLNHGRDRGRRGGRGRLLSGRKASREE